ncbi:hypothetical protein [Yimella lutea]|nr:hypothetical protein [Yimella lutea]
MSEPTQVAEVPMFTLSFLQDTHQAGYDAGFADGLRAAEDIANAEFEAARAVVHSAAGGDRHPFWDALNVDPVNDPWAEVAERLEEARETHRRAVHDSLRGGAA